MNGEAGAWWEQGRIAVALALVTALPLLWPDVPPLIDLPGHMGRYRVEIDLAGSPALQQFYSFRWALIGNLGVDLLVIPLSKLVGLEMAVKLVILAIPPMTAGGFLWVAREVHGRIPPTALFALPLVYSFPFNFGFVNFALSMAFAMLAFGLWLRLARTGRFRLRAILFVPISLLIWVTHTFGWGTLGVLAFAAEIVRQHDRNFGVVRAGLNAAFHCLSLAPPILLMLLWRNAADVGGETGNWLNWRAKLAWIFMSLRDRWQIFDLASITVILVLIARAINSKRIGFERSLADTALFLLLVFLLLPVVIFGSTYADMRLAPFMLAVAILGIRLHPGQDPQLARTLALAGLAFFLVRIGANTVSFALYDRAYDRELAALDHVPHGARLVSFVGTPCRQPWAVWRMSRLDHLPGMAVVRRHAFSNDQWPMTGGPLLTANHAREEGFAEDPTQIVTAIQCPGEKWRSLDNSLRYLPRQAFDYVWLIDPPAYDARLTRGLEPIWRAGSSVLFRVADRAPPAAAAAPAR